MIAKLQALGQAAKNVLLYIITPVLFVFGCIFYFWRKEKDLENEVAEAHADQKLEGLQDEQKTVDSNAADAVANYNKLLGEYSGPQNIGSNVSPSPVSVQRGGKSSTGAGSGT